MIAAVVPYYHGQACLVVGSETHIYDVGRLLCRAHDMGGCAECDALPKSRELRYRREVTDRDVSTLVSDIESDAATAGADRIVVERVEAGDGVEQGRAYTIEAALVEVLGAESRELPKGAPRKDIEMRARALLGDGDGSESSVKARIEPHSQDRAGRVPHEEAPAKSAETLTSSGIERGAGIDPGSRWVAVAILDERGFVDARQFEVGRAVVLPKPRIVTRGDGSTYEITSKRIVEDEDIERLIGTVASYLVEQGVTRVAVERANHFHAGDGEGNHARAAGLARAQWVGGELAGALRAEPTSDGENARFRVITRSSAQWRAALKLRGKTWREGLALRLPSLPPGEHIADAAGVGLTLYPVAVKRAPKKEPGKPQRRRAAQERRDAVGCKCGRAHRLPCPIAVEVAERVRSKMMGNQRARKRDA